LEDFIDGLEAASRVNEPVLILKRQFQRKSKRRPNVAYQIRLKKSAEKELDKLPLNTLILLSEKIRL
jgi:hypothetical protein